MANITTPRRVVWRTIGYAKRPVAANVKCIKGGLAALKAGYVQPASTDPLCVPIGFFAESIDNTGGALGAKSCDVEHFDEFRVFLMDNDTVAPVTAAMRGLQCSLVDDHTVAAFNATPGPAGVVFDVDSEGVWVFFPVSGPMAEAT